MTDCLFCKMVSAEIQPDSVYEDDDVLAFRDINPQTPVHILIIPKQHIATLNDASEEHVMLMGKLMVVAKQLAAREGVDQDGYRLVVNCNQHGGQAVYHVHLHLLGGRQMGWPPG